ncbi:AAA family ATPase [Streptomyces niveus]|uniref:AAA family ATPase n=1 Tax=Streptomyces niveus TaxID=193462 RepID=UPI0036D375B9
MTTEGWGVFRGDGTPHDVTWPEPPPWRRFGNRVVPRPVEAPFPYVIADGDRDVVNTALHLHRPLLVTGKPGTGKSTLARAVARELRLGEVLHWPVNSRTTLADGLYRYDAVGRLRDASMKGREAAEPDIGDYLRLGALGTALLPHDRPRVLLVDELDKGDVDLPNDLLTVFEEGRYEIPELSRLKGSDVRVRVTGSDEKVTVTDGMVSCRTFPVVVITSNGERDFPPAFLRRCVRLDIKQPSEEQLREIVAMHLGAVTPEAERLIADFLDLRENHALELATDQLLNAVHLRTTGVGMSYDILRETVLRSLDEVGA